MRFPGGWAHPGIYKVCGGKKQTSGINLSGPSRAAPRPGSLTLPRVKHGFEWLRRGIPLPFFSSLFFSLATHI